MVRVATTTMRIDLREHVSVFIFLLVVGMNVRVFELFG